MALWKAMKGFEEVSIESVLTGMAGGTEASSAEGEALEASVVAAEEAEAGGGAEEEAEAEGVPGIALFTAS